MAHINTKSFSNLSINCWFTLNLTFFPPSRSIIDDESVPNEHMPGLVEIYVIWVNNCAINVNTIGINIYAYDEYVYSFPS